jgi:hypothetical protein
MTHGNFLLQVLIQLFYRQLLRAWRGPVKFKNSEYFLFVEAGWWPVLELHTQGQSARGQYFFDLVERLTT